MRQKPASSADRDPLEARILGELQGIEIRMNELRLEKEALERVLISVRRNNNATVLSDVTRKNSIKRVLIEGIVLDNLKMSAVSVSTHHLYTSVRRIDWDLKENTFRSTLHRMKGKGLIVNPKEGQWELSVVSGDRIKV